MPLLSCYSDVSEEDPPAKDVAKSQRLPWATQVCIVDQTFAKVPLGPHFKFTSR